MVLLDAHNIGSVSNEVLRPFIINVKLIYFRLKFGMSSKFLCSIWITSSLVCAFVDP